MMSDWQRLEIESILVQLEDRNLPFDKYRYIRKAEGLRRLGCGNAGYVYEAERVGNTRRRYAVKITGFNDYKLDSESFRRIVSEQKWINNAVKIYDTAELLVWVDAEANVTDARLRSSLDKDELLTGHYLELQFVVMERLEPVYSRQVITGNGRCNNMLYPDVLARMDEQEILHLAQDIGEALLEAHANNLLHLDVKLENIFYSERRHKYLLGDFDIAEKTEDGMVRISGGTLGYCAPEVHRRQEAKCDNTADIYSFGMVLYLLLNQMRFPDAKGYKPNMAIQYMDGYVLSEPVGGSRELVEIVLKMCSFYPEDRYQLMGDVLRDLNATNAGIGVRYLHRHLPRTLLLCLSCGIMGVLTLLIMSPLEITNEGGLGIQIWIGCCVLHCLYYYQQDPDVRGELRRQSTWNALLSLVILGLGIYLAVRTGITWWKMIIPFICAVEEAVAGIVGVVWIALYIITWINAQVNVAAWLGIDDIRWLSIALLSLAVVLALQYAVGRLYNHQDRTYRTMRIMYFYAYWGLIAAVYGSIIMTSILMMNTTAHYNPWRRLLHPEWITALDQLGIGKIGWVGLAFSLFMLLVQFIGMVEQWLVEMVTRYNGVNSD